ncbi:MAG: hypothetical protein B6I29_05120 [Marinitoga sp. 4572_148]|nr:MAG: hypothetical protein B6I29_05120 [Marinitoga sp. 4572_148]
MGKEILVVITIGLLAAGLIGGMLFFNSSKAETSAVNQEVTKEISTEGLVSLLNNSSFDEMIVDNEKDPSHWFVWQASTYKISGARVSDLEVKDGYIAITVADPGADTWHIQFDQDVKLEKGKTYVFSFKAKADAPRKINAKILQNHDPYTNYFAKTVDLTTEWQTFTFEYTHPETADEVVRVSFELGKDVSTTIYFDDIIIANK